MSWLLSLAILAASFAGGQGSSNYKLKIGFIVKEPDEAWFQDEWKWAEKAGAKEGFEVVPVAATSDEAVSTVIDALAEQGVKGFVICPPNVRSGALIAKKAAQRGMKFMTVDDRLLDVAKGRSVFLNVPHMGLSALLVGAQVGSALRAESRRRGWKDADTGLLVLTFDLLSSARERTDGAVQTLKSAGFPAGRVFRAPLHQVDVPGGMDSAARVLAAHKSVKHWLVCGINDEAVLGGVRATERAGFKPQAVLAVGIGGTSVAQDEFAKQTLSGFWGTILISPRRHGYDTSEMVFKWVTQGIEPPKVTWTAGVLMTRIDYIDKVRVLGP